MKKLLCLCLALVTLCTFVACGPGGDANMHKLMQAIKNGDVVPDDASNEYFVKTSEDYSSQTNENYMQVRAYVDGTGHCKHRLDFRAGKYQTVKDASQIDLSMDTYYQNGEFVAADATVAGDNECTDASIALFNEAFNALHEIYAKQGCPFK